MSFTINKIYKKGSLEYYKMCHGFLLMMLVYSKDHGGNRYITARKYEHLKLHLSERMSILQSGEEKHTIWNNVDLQPSIEKTKNILEKYQPGGLELIIGIDF